MGQKHRDMSRSEEIRASNLRITQQAERLRFVSRVPLLCECGQPDCRELILLHPTAYRQQLPLGLVTAPGHTIV
jgi:hypothetical protein